MLQILHYLAVSLGMLITQHNA